MGTKGGSCRYRTPRCLRHNHFQSSRSCPSADEHPETMKMPEVTPLPNSPAPLPSPQGRGKRGRGERVRGIFKAVKRALWRVLRFQGRSDADAAPDIDLERCAELLRFELPSAIATPRAPCPATASQEQTRASTEGTQGILGGRRGGLRPTNSRVAAAWRRYRGNSVPQMSDRSDRQCNSSDFEHSKDQARGPSITGLEVGLSASTLALRRGVQFRITRASSKPPNGPAR